MMRNLFVLLGLSTAVGQICVNVDGSESYPVVDFNDATNPALELTWKNYFGEEFTGTRVPPLSNDETDGAFPRGSLRWKNVGSYEGVPMDMKVTVPSGADQSYFGPNIQLQYVSPNNSRTSQAVAVIGIACLGFGLGQSICTDSDYVPLDPPVPPERVSAFCESGYEIMRATEFLIEFMHVGTDDPMPAFDRMWVTYFDVDGDAIDTGFDGWFDGYLYELNSVKEARVRYVPSYSTIATGEFFTGELYGISTQPINNQGINQPNFSVLNPARMAQPAIIIFEIEDRSSLTLVYGGRSSFNGNYNGTPVHDYGNYGAGGYFTDTTGEGRTGYNDRGYCFAMPTPPPCECDTECVVGCSPCPANCTAGGGGKGWLGADCPVGCGIAPEGGTCENLCPPGCINGGAAAGTPTDPFGYVCPDVCGTCSVPCPEGCENGETVAADGNTTCPSDCSTNICPKIPLPPPFPPPFPPAKCMEWCNEYTCDSIDCAGCDACEEVEAGNACASWCNEFTCEKTLCSGCDVCEGSSTSCHAWCSRYTCFAGTGCSSCPVCSGDYCASWCNPYTCGGLFSSLCSGCSVCDEVNNGMYCASWCNQYTTSGVFSHVCGGC